MGGCAFCDIAAGKARVRLVHEDDDAIAFFPRHMEVRGHTLVVPRMHVATWSQLPTEVIGPLFVAAQLVSRRLEASLGAEDVNVLFAGGPEAQQSVRHFHMHVLPRWHDDAVNAWPALPGCQDDPDELLELLSRGRRG